MRSYDDVKAESQQLDTTRAALSAWTEAVPVRIAELERTIGAQLTQIVNGDLPESAVDPLALELLRLKTLQAAAPAGVLHIDAEKRRLAPLLERGAAHQLARRERVQFVHIFNRVVTTGEMSDEERRDLLRLAPTEQDRRLVDDVIHAVNLLRTTRAPIKVRPLPVKVDDSPIMV